MLNYWHHKDKVHLIIYLLLRYLITNCNIHYHPLNVLKVMHLEHQIFAVYLSTSSCKQTTVRRSSPSPIEKLHNVEKSSTVLWTKNRWYDDTSGNSKTLKAKQNKQYAECAHHTYTHE